jgi:phosphoribosyl 1,2-cyclic phosphodiesterase
LTIRFRIIASGSNGNASYISTPDGTIIIDAGISRKRILAALEQDDIGIDSIIGILITHGHTDHISGLPVLASSLDVPIYCTLGTKEELKKLSYRDPRWDSVSEYSYILSYKEPFLTENEAFTIIPLKTVHDAAEAAAFHIIYDDVGITTVTDTGDLTDDILRAIRASHIALVEMNHDVDALRNSMRPVWLKERIRNVHLSNRKTISYFGNLVESKLKALFIGHLSGECNSPDLVANSLFNWTNEQSIPWNWYLSRRDKTCEAITLSSDTIKTNMKPMEVKPLEFTKRKTKVDLRDFFT